MTAFASLPAVAQDPQTARTVEVLRQDCTGVPREQVSCIRFLGGVASTMMLLGDLTQSPGVSGREKMALAALGLCPEAGLSGGRIREAFVAWAEKHPENRYEPEQLGAMAALVSTWPCK
jgi:hypothetical protein